jgi:hypothetical protein
VSYRRLYVEFSRMERKTKIRVPEYRGPLSLKVNLRPVLFNVVLVAFADAPATIIDLEKQASGLELARADPKTSDEVKKIITPILTGKLQQLTNLLDGALKEISGFPESERSGPRRSYTAALKRVEADKKIYRSLLCDERLALELMLNPSKNLSDTDKSTIRDRVKQISNELPASACKQEK